MNTTTTTSRALVAAAALAFPVLAATTAAAQAGPDDPSKALVEHRESQLAQADGQRAAQASRQQSYVDGLERAAAAENTAARAARAAYAAQQRSYQEHVAAAARGVVGDNATRAQSASGATSGDTGDGVSVPVAALLALGGLALGAGATLASRRLPTASHRRVAV